jgi:hypothetical protein
MRFRVQTVFFFSSSSSSSPSSRDFPLLNFQKGYVFLERHDPTIEDVFFKRDFCVDERVQELEVTQ